MAKSKSQSKSQPKSQEELAQAVRDAEANHLAVQNSHNEKVRKHNELVREWRELGRNNSPELQAKTNEIMALKAEIKALASEIKKAEKAISKLTRDLVNSTIPDDAHELVGASVTKISLMNKKYWSCMHRDAYRADYLVQMSITLRDGRKATLFPYDPERNNIPHMVFYGIKGEDAGYEVAFRRASYTEGFMKVLDVRALTDAEAEKIVYGGMNDSVMGIVIGYDDQEFLVVALMDDEGNDFDNLAYHFSGKNGKTEEGEDVYIIL